MKSEDATLRGHAVNIRRRVSARLFPFLLENSYYIEPFYLEDTTLDFAWESSSHVAILASRIAAFWWGEPLGLGLDSPVTPRQIVLLQATIYVSSSYSEVTLLYNLINYVER